MDYMIIFAMFGLFAIPCMVLALICADTIKGKIKGMLVCLAFWAFVSCVFWKQATVNAELWNNGYCECGAHWELKGVTKSKMGSVTKYYACPECYAEIEINE